MTLLNWLPEILLLVQFALVLGGMSFRMTSSHLLIVISGVVSTLTFFYYGARPDLFTFDSPIPILMSDAVSRYCRLISLLFVSVGSWQFGFHSGLSVEAKHRGMMGLILAGLFLCLLSQSNHFVSTYIGMMGLMISGFHLVLSESNSSQDWIQTFRRSTYSILSLTGIFLILFLTGLYICGSGSIHDFAANLQTASLNIQYFTGFILILFVFQLFHSLRLLGSAPIALPFVNLFLMFAAMIFWIRVAVPFFASPIFLPKIIAQGVLGLVIASASIRYSLGATRTHEPNQWLSNTLMALFALGFYPLLLSANQALPILFTLIIGLMMTTMILGRAFLGGTDRNRWFAVVAILAGVGFPPLTLGYQYFLILKQIHAADLGVFSVAFLVSWFFISAAAVQMIAQVLRDHKNQPQQNIAPSQIVDWSLLAIVVLCTILMTAFGSDLIERLNTQPIPNLW